MNREETFEVYAEVFAVIAEYHQAVARSPDNYWHLEITRLTAGVLLDEVQEGQIYLLTVTCRLHRVLHARLVDPKDDRYEPFLAEVNRIGRRR